MKRMAVFVLVACLAACTNQTHTHIGGLSTDERAGITASTRDCDYAGSGAASDPASPCFVARGPD